MEMSSLTYHRHHPLSPTHRHHHRTAVTFITFPNQAISCSSSSMIKASFRNPNYENPKVHDHITTKLITGVTLSACLLLSRNFNVEPAIAAPPPPATVEPLPEPEDTRIITITKDTRQRFKEVEKYLLEKMELTKICRRDQRSDLKLMLAHIRIIQGDYNDALKIYEDLRTEHPLNFKPYLTRVIVYTLLGKNHEDDAQNNLKMAEKVRLGRFLLMSDYLRLGVGLLLLGVQILAMLGIRSRRKRRERRWSDVPPL